MATTLASDFKIYNAEFQAGVWEGITQFIAAFGSPSKNAIRLLAESLIGHYEKEAIFADVANLITRRDITSVAAATALKMTQLEKVGVKVNRKIGPVDSTLDSLKKIGKDQAEMSFVLGKMVGQKKAQDMLNTGILAVEAAIEGQSTNLNYDVTGLTTKTLITSYLVTALSKMGDMSERIVAWVMHSKPYFDLVGSQIGDKITNVADRVIYGGTPGTLNRPVIISDIPALHDANSTLTDTYNVLGLVEDGVTVKESEQSEMIVQPVTGLEQLVVRMQGEYAFNLGCRGFTWDVTNGGANPTDAALGTTTNWDKIATDIKDCAGVRIVCQ